MSTTETPTEAGSNLTRTLLIVLGALVVLAGLWFLVVAPLLAGDDDGEGDEITIDRPDVAEEPATEGEGTDIDVVAALPIETYEVFLSRDPFEPVIPVFDGGGGDGSGDGSGDDGGGTDGGGTDGGGTDGGGTDGGGTDGGAVNNAVLIDVFIDDTGEERALVRVGDLLYTVGEGDLFDDGYVVVSIDATCITLTKDGSTSTLCEGGTTPGGGDGEGCSGSDEVVCDGQVVSLVDVFTDGAGVDRAVIQVDNQLYEVQDGDVFAQNYQVLAIDPPCVTLLFGDDAFTLCEGERVLK